MKNAYRVLVLALFATLSISLANTAHAAQNPVFYLRTDRASYSPGDSGSLMITIRNQGDQSFTIKNISVTFPWLSYLNDHWDGNATINNINLALASGGATYNTQQSFTTPSDGRAYSFGSGTIRVGTDIGGSGGSYITSTFRITMNAPTYTPLGISTSIFSILLVGIMAVATVLLFLLNAALRKPRTAQTTH